MIRPLPFLSTILLSTILLGACASLAPQTEDSPFYPIPEGSRLILNGDLIVPARQLKVYVQGARLATDAARLYPYCVFELRQRQSTPQRIKADTFTIYNVSSYIDYIAGIDNPRRQYASLKIFQNSGEGPGLVTYATHLDLRSPEQPQVLRMICAILQDYDISSHHLSIQQIRAALGNTFTLQLPSG